MTRRFEYLRLLAAGTAAVCAAPLLFSQTVDFGSGKPRDADKHTTALVVAEGVRLLTSWAGGAPLPGPLAFRAVVDNYRQTPNGYLLAKTKDGRWGWLSETDVLWKDQNCMRVDPVKNPALRKVALRNNWQQQDLKHEVEFFDSPTRNRVVGTDKIAGFYYVFAERATRADGKDLKVLLLGLDPQWDSVRPEIHVTGWVPESQVTQWYSRMAVWYNQANIATRDKVRIFETEDALKLYLKDGTRGRLIAQEGVPRPLKFDDDRFPVLLERRYDERTLGMKVFSIIDARPRAARPAADDPSVASRVEELNRAIERARNIQVLFVLDATKSMQPYFKAVSSAIEEYLGSIPVKNEVARYHFAAAIYRDYVDDLTPADASEGCMKKAACVIADFGADVPGQLTKVVADSSPDDHDYPEAVYHGIGEAIKGVKWEAGQVRAVVVIGDHGNHDPDRDERALTPAGVVQILNDPPLGVPTNAGILFHAINVNVRQKWLPYNDMFKSQMQTISAGSKAKLDSGVFAAGVRRLPIVPDNAEAFPEELAKAAREAKDEVKRSLEAVFNATREFDERILQRLRSGADCGAQEAEGTLTCDYFRDLLKEGGVSPNSDLSQISQEGWLVKERDGKQFVAPWVWISKTDMASLAGFLSNMEYDAALPASKLSGALARLGGITL